MGFKGSMSLPGWESTRGTNHRLCRLSDEQIREIRNSEEEIEAIATKYKISVGYATKIKRRLVRKEVK